MENFETKRKLAIKKLAEKEKLRKEKKTEVTGVFTTNQQKYRTISRTPERSVAFGR